MANKMCKNITMDHIKTASKFKKFVVILVLFLVMLAVLFILKINQPEYNFSSQLVEALDIAELSTSELIYNGIVDVYDGDGQKIMFSVNYDATVNVGIQMDDIEFEINETQRTVKPILPTITIRSPVVDPSSIDYIPQNPNVDLKVVMSACKKDAQHEAEKSEKLIQTAEENLKSIIEALLYPIVEDAGYSIEW